MLLLGRQTGALPTAMAIRDRDRRAGRAAASPGGEEPESKSVLRAGSPEKREGQQGCN